MDGVNGKGGGYGNKPTYKGLKLSWTETERNLFFR